MTPQELHSGQTLKELQWRFERHRGLSIWEAKPLNGVKYFELSKTLRSICRMLQLCCHVIEILIIPRALIQFFQDIIMYGFTTFLPSILQLDLNFTSIQAQYLSIPVYLLGGITFFVSEGPFNLMIMDANINSLLLCLEINGDYEAP